MNIEVIRYRLPVYWACALINGDYTGLSDEEEREINNFLEQAEGYPVDVDLETEGFYRCNDANDIAGKEPKAKMCLKQFFGIEIEPEYKFKPFDKVLVRDTEDDDWHVSLFVRKIADAQYKEERYECLNGTGWIYCIPYEGNEHFL